MSKNGDVWFAVYYGVITYEVAKMNPKTISRRCDEILAKLSACMPNFEVREAQQRLMNGISHICAGKSLNNEKARKHIIAECPTGSGKSLSALIPAISYIEALRKEHIDDVRVVYATATVSLQNQLARDFELLEQAGVKVNYHTAVGRGRFICKKNANILLQKPTDTQESLSFDSGEHLIEPIMDLNIDENDVIAITHLMDALDKGIWSGMKDDLQAELSVKPKIWEKIKSNSHNCSKSCRHYSKESCPFVANRQRMSEADVVVTNQAMLFTDIDSALVLPDIEKSLVILDEGHKAFEIFAQQQEAAVNINSLTTLSGQLKHYICGTVDNIYKANGSEKKAPTQVVNQHLSELSNEVKMFSSSLNNAFQHATQHQNKLEKSQGIWEMNVNDVFQYQLHTPMSNMKNILNVLVDLLQGTLELAKKLEDDTAIDRGVSVISEQLAIISSSLDTFEYFLSPEKFEPVALWCQKSEKDKYVSLNAACIDMSEQMKEVFWNRVKHCVLMSATLRIDNSFHRICSQMGVDRSMAYVVALPSPFKTAYENSNLYLYPDIPTPDWRDTISHSTEVAKCTAEFMNIHLGGLLLVNSRKQLEEIVSMLPNELADMALIQDGRVSRDALIKKHKERVMNKQKSLLIGMASFAEGIDLKGELLTFVGICKLHFGHSNGPRTKAEAKYINNNGGNAFEQLILPETERYLQQSIGRLIRSMSDRGDIAIFDSRCVKKSYGNRLIQCLPEFNVVHQHKKMIA